MELISRISNLLVTLIMIGIIVISGVLIIPRIFGFEIYGVLSGSMEPAYPVGSVVFVKKEKPENIVVGDAITFYLEGIDSVVATHRVIGLNQEDKTFTTKGDANTVADGDPLPFEQLIGKVKASVPYLGYIALFIQTRYGIMAGIGVFLLVLFLSLLSDLFKQETKENIVEVHPRS